MNASIEDDWRDYDEDEKDYKKIKEYIKRLDDMREIHSGTVLRTSVPEYGGTEVTFHVKGFQDCSIYKGK